MSLRRRIEVYLTTPLGVVYDVTTRLARLRSLRDRIEEDLLELVHGDLVFSLDDRDGVIEGVLAGAESGDEYRITVWRETGERRPKYELMFSGVLDLPYSVRIDREDKDVRLTVFALSKLLEQVDAETAVARDLTLTGTVAAGNNTVTVSPDADDLSPGDEITLYDDDDSETQIIDTVDRASNQVDTVDNFSSEFTDADIDLETPYPRNSNPEALTRSLFAAAGFAHVDIQLPTSGVPRFVTPVHPLFITGTPDSVTTEGEAVSVVDDNGTQQADDLVDEFSEDSSDTDPEIDWTRYYDIEPGSVLRETVVSTSTDLWTWDYSDGNRYETDETHTAIGAGPPFSASLVIKDSGATTLETVYSTSGEASFTVITHSCDIDPATSKLWVAFTCTNGTSQVRIYDISLDSISTLISEERTGLVVCSQLDAVLMYNETSHAVEQWDTATEALVGQFNLPDGYKFRGTRDTIRANSLYLFVPVSRGTVSSICVFRTSDRGLAATVKIDSALWPTTATIFKGETDDIGSYVFVADDAVWVLAAFYRGVIPYADFDGLSVAKALQELALISLAFVTVDQDEVAYMIGRETYSASVPIVALPTPLQQRTMLRSEDYAESVRVTAKTESGDEIEQTGGDQGASARRSELDSTLITTDSVALAVAEAYTGTLSRIRAEENVRVIDAGIRALQRVTLDGRSFDVREVKTDLDDEEQELRLIEVV